MSYGVVTFFFVSFCMMLVEEEELSCACAGMASFAQPRWTRRVFGNSCNIEPQCYHIVDVKCSRTQ